MIDYIIGTITKIYPTFVVVETGGIGYFANISLNTFSKLEKQKECKLFVHEIIREDSHTLYGFADEQERDLYRLLISVNGVGPSTANVMLSSLSVDEIKMAISESNVNVLKGIKGIGLKTAQRIVVDLKDKVDKQGLSGELFGFADNTNRDEALSALVMLGFNKSAVTKVLDNIIKKENGLSVEELIKRSLKNL
ncbi:MAG: Holliday junction branch migration protein RuvA [Bacteroidales bacterium]|nr:Holliday junction branch migration protein RuvA [Bacteroidales bacterium]